mmetsp:Transcript_34559/g.55674  ORF Transcript_34559/g.55674 Transcript_34559/m.55674 type:complete len:234 (-) Transcript_34559:7267-7968(-)
MWRLASGEIKSATDQGYRQLTKAPEFLLLSSIGIDTPRQEKGFVPDKEAYWLAIGLEHASHRRLAATSLSGNSSLIPVLITAVKPSRVTSSTTIAPKLVTMSWEGSNLLFSESETPSFTMIIGRVGWGFGNLMATRRQMTPSSRSDWPSFENFKRSSPRVCGSRPRTCPSVRRRPSCLLLFVLWNAQRTWSVRNQDGFPIRPAKIGRGSTSSSSVGVWVWKVLQQIEHTILSP